MTAKAFVNLLEQHRYDFFSGVPCSLLEGVLSVLETRPVATISHSPTEIRDRFRAALGSA